MRRRTSHFLAAFALTLTLSQLAACGHGQGEAPPVDTGTVKDTAGKEASTDSGSDSPSDTGRDALIDSTADSSFDGSQDTSAESPDLDTGSDISPDVPFDSFVIDAAADVLDDGSDVSIDVSSEAGSGSIAGTFDMSLRVVSMGTKSLGPQAGFGVRAESAAGFLEAKTGSDGTAHLMVDLSKGPFDVTVAKIGFDAVSVLGTSESLGDIIVLEYGAASAYKNAPISGSVTGTSGLAGEKVQIDGWHFGTVFASSSTWNYASNYQYVDPASTDIPLPLAALDAVPAGGGMYKAVNAVLTSAVPRTGAAMVIDVAFPTSPPTLTTATLNVNFPTTGLITASMFDRVALLTYGALGNALVVQGPVETQMFVGIGYADTPTSGVSTIKVQSFDGKLTPDAVEAAWAPKAKLSPFARVNLRTLADGSVFTFGTVNKDSVSGTTLGDLKFELDSVAFDSTSLALSDFGGPAWILYRASPKIELRSLPHLPKGVTGAGLAGGGPFSATTAFVKQSSSKKAWALALSDEECDGLMRKTETTVFDSAGR